ncbi:hypothetical protein [Sulfurimonas diazotrophicus]|uniref:Uncharacterized protein n=1 Tax=Sulfurimonas diazotrophicus TaxID=3131939 RepID=A0ABZ3HDV9_9BACT
MDEKIIKIITFIDPNNALVFNPVHMIFWAFIAFPIILIHWSAHPILMSIFAFLTGVQFILFCLKLLVKDQYAAEIEEVKSSLPDFNLFHIVMFGLIASPVLFIAYGVISAMLE